MRLRVWLSLAFGLVLFLFCLRTFDGRLFLAAMTDLWVVPLLAALALSLVTWGAMTLQWRLFLPPGRPLPLFRLLQITPVYAMLANNLPFYSGHALMLYIVGEREGVGKTATLSLLTVEQVTDSMGKLLWFGAIAFLYPFPEWMRPGIEGVVLWALAGYLFLVIAAYRFRDRKEIGRPVGWKRIFSWFARWAHHLHAVRDFRKMIGGVLLAAAMKGVEIVSIWLVQKSLGVDLPPHAPLLVFAALSLTTVLPAVPARIGIFEAAAFVVYQSFGIDPTRALTLGLLIHLVHTVPFLILGYFFTIRLGLRSGGVTGAVAKGF